MDATSKTGPALAPGSKFAGSLTAGGQRLAEALVTLKDQLAADKQDDTAATSRRSPYRSVTVDGPAHQTELRVVPSIAIAELPAVAVRNAFRSARSAFFATSR